MVKQEKNVNVINIGSEHLLTATDVIISNYKEVKLSLQNQMLGKFCRWRRI